MIKGYKASLKLSCI